MIDLTEGFKLGHSGNFRVRRFQRSYRVDFMEFSSPIPSENSANCSVNFRNENESKIDFFVLGTNFISRPT